MFNFDLTQVQDQSSVIPKGKYRAQVEDVELKDTNAGTGKYISAQFVVTDEKQNGRKFWHLFNIVNPNEKAVKIGLGQIKQLISASGGTPGLFKDPSELVGLECLVTLKEYEDDYGVKNKVTSFAHIPNELPKEASDTPPF